MRSSVLISLLLICLMIGLVHAAFPACLKLVELGDEVRSGEHCTSSSSTGTTTHTTSTHTSTRTGHTTHHTTRCTPYYSIDAAVMVYPQEEDGGCSSTGTLGTLVYMKDQDEYTIEQVGEFKSKVRTTFGPIIGIADNTTTPTSDFGRYDNGEIRIFDRSSGEYYMKKSSKAGQIIGIIVGVVVGVIFLAVCLTIIGVVCGILFCIVTGR